MEENAKLLQLIDLAVVNPARIDLYKQALPKMTAEEKAKMIMQLWTTVLTTLHQRTVSRMESMMAEMAAEGSEVVYEKEDFKKVHDTVVNEFMAERLGEADEDELAELRRELRGIGKKVWMHEIEIDKIKKKFSGDQ